MMTRTNYVVIAAILNKARELHPTQEATEAIEAVTNMLSGAFITDNPNFDMNKFRLAAGVKQL